MDTVELDRLCASLAGAKSAEEVFGELHGSQEERLEAARHTYWQMAKIVHPDLFQNMADFEQAGSAFKLLSNFWEQAQTRIKQGIYGTSAPQMPLNIRTSTQLYTIERVFAQGDLAALSLATFIQDDKITRCMLKGCIQPTDNDLLANEAEVLEHLRASKEYPARRHFVSQLLDSFVYQEQATGILRQFNVLAYQEGFYSLKEVREAYPQGVDPRHMAWMWRRLLVALAFAHANEVIHGAVLPTHVLIHPKLHGVILIDWSYAVLDPAQTGCYISALSSAYRDWYPSEVFAREVPTPGLDISMAASCMIDLIGGNPHERTMPASVPWQLQNYLKGCTLPNPRQRPQDAYALLADFDALIERLWGPRTYHEFSMPKIR